MKRFSLVSTAFAVSLAFSQISLAKEGGVSGGGGNLLPGEQASPAEVIYSIQQLKFELPYYFNGLEILKGSSDVSGTFSYQGLEYSGVDVSAVRHLFLDGSTTVFDILPGITFIIKEKGPCFDGNGNAVDASAVDGAPNEVCFSIDRIAPKLHKGQTHIPILALGVHEISHKLGANEGQAVAAQGAVLAWVGDRSYSDAQNYTRYLISVFDGQINSLQSILDRIDTSATTEQNCLSIGMINSVDSQLNNAINHSTEETPFRKYQNDRILAETLRLIYTFQYCIPESDPKKQEYRDRFSGIDRVNLRDFTLTEAKWGFDMGEALGTLLGGKANGKLDYEPGPGSVHYLTYGATELVKLELTETIQALVEMKKVLPNN